MVTVRRYSKWPAFYPLYSLSAEIIKLLNKQLIHFRVPKILITDYASFNFEPSAPSNISDGLKETSSASPSSSDFDKPDKNSYESSKSQYWYEFKSNGPIYV